VDYDIVDHDVVDHDVADSTLAELGDRRIEWAERRMPVLRAIRERFGREKPLTGVTVGACMHVTSETANLMHVLRAGGARVSLCASNPLSTQDDVAAALVAAGIPVFAIRGEDSDTFYRHISAVLDTRPDLVFDDGCDMTTVLHEQRADQPVIGGMEETTTGVIRLRAMQKAGVLRFPVVAVNDSDTKHLFDNRHGTGQSSLDGILRASNILFAGRTVVVAGYGDCGYGIANRADGLGASVIVVESNPVRALSAAMDGHRVMTSRDAAPLGDVFISATGDIHVFRKEHFAVMKDSAILANAGHFDVELDLKELAEMAQGYRELRDNLGEYALPDGKRLMVVAEGRLVNLGAAEGHPADVMDMSFADQALAAEWLKENGPSLDPDVYVLPQELDYEVARLKLESMGGGLEILTAEQDDYLGSWQHGT
jgi:adenosylhomocysteinase